MLSGGCAAKQVPFRCHSVQLFTLAVSSSGAPFALLVTLSQSASKLSPFHCHLPLLLILPVSPSASSALQSCAYIISQSVVSQSEPLLKPLYHQLDIYTRVLVVHVLKWMKISFVCFSYHLSIKVYKELEKDAHCGLLR